ncbi:hypothetical protein ABEB36_013248 [Hypothenemus hampei]|uniref:Uncharacterized protein n=1 Tax=Hypothenemus hampei TaxID=57062 RepID=A0ABD1E7E4_HYPHA
MLLVVTVFIVIFCSVQAEIPSYIKVCKRNDPNLSKCMLDSIELLRPKLKSGIPELDVPPLEPLPLNEIKLRTGPDQAQINCNLTNLLVYGPSTFKTLDLKPDMKKTRFLAQFTIPILYFEGEYDIDMNILLLKYKGQGPIQGNLTDYVVNCVLKADKIQKENQTYLKFRKFNLTLFTGKSYLYLRNLFPEYGTVLADGTNSFIHENTDLFMNEIKPALEDSLADKFTDIANSIMEKFPFDALFPDG